MSQHPPLELTPSPLPPPPYATASAYPKVHGAHQSEPPPPSYHDMTPQYDPNPVIIYLDRDECNGTHCILCDAPTRRDVSVVAVLCTLVVVILTLPFGLALLCCVPCLLHRKCTRCGAIQ